MELSNWAKTKGLTFILTLNVFLVPHAHVIIWREGGLLYEKKKKISPIKRDGPEIRQLLKAIQKSPEVATLQRPQKQKTKQKKQLLQRPLKPIPWPYDPRPLCP